MVFYFVFLASVSSPSPTHLSPTPHPHPYTKHMHSCTYMQYYISTDTHKQEASPVLSSTTHSIIHHTYTCIPLHTHAPHHPHTTLTFIHTLPSTHTTHLLTDIRTHSYIVIRTTYHASLALVNIRPTYYYTHAASSK